MVIDNAEASTFKGGIGLWYATDGNSAYYKGNVIENSDGKTFKYLGGTFSIDKNNVYTDGKIIENADPNMCPDWNECNKNYPK